MSATRAVAHTLVYMECAEFSFILQLVYKKIHEKWSKRWVDLHSPLHGACRILSGIPWIRNYTIMIIPSVHRLWQICLVHVILQ